MMLTNYKILYYIINTTSNITKNNILYSKVNSSITAVFDNSILSFDQGRVGRQHFELRLAFSLSQYTN